MRRAADDCPTPGSNPSYHKAPLMSTPTKANPPFPPSPEAPVRDAPAFDFYPERWLVGVASLSDAEQLAYLRLLCHQWLQQGLPADVPALKRLGGKGVTPAVLAKLPLQVDGRRRNARLEIIRTEQRQRIAKASEKARKMAASRWHKHTPPEHAPAADEAPALPVAWLPQHAASHAAALPEECLHQHAASTAAFLHTACPPPTADRPPPTSVLEDANKAGAGAHDPPAAGPVASSARVPEAPAAAACAQAAAGSGFHPSGDATGAGRASASGSAPDEDEAARHTPDLPTVRAWAAMIGCPPDKAEIWWHEHEARPLSRMGRWTDRDGNAVQRPQHALAAWWQKWQANDHQRATRLQPPPSAGYHATARTTTPRSDAANRPGRYA